jgi:uncharacterized damage-inducible protein DinB
MSPQVAQLVAIMDQAYNKTSWHGTNLRGSLRAVSAAQAAWRPSSRRHNIWEVAVHAAYWKYAVARRFTGGARGSFPVKGSNWFRRPVAAGRPVDKAWKADVELLDDMHSTLRDVVLRLSARDLAGTPPGKKVSNFALLSGIAAHDIYHAGQIQLLKRMQSR